MRNNNTNKNWVIEIESNSKIDNKKKQAVITQIIIMRFNNFLKENVQTMIGHKLLIMQISMRNKNYSHLRRRQIKTKVMKIFGLKEIYIKIRIYIIKKIVQN